MNSVNRRISRPFDIVQSATFMYPFYVCLPLFAPILPPSDTLLLLTIQGLVYLLSNKSLWPMYITILVPQVIIMVLCYAVVMVLVFPSFGFLSIIFLGPAGLTWTWLAIVQLSVQASTIVTTLLLMPEIEKLVFDSVLSKEFNDDLVLLGKLRRIKHVPFLVKFTNFIFSVPTWFIVPFLILRAIMIIVFGLIPVVGPLLVAYIKAPTRGLQAHARYFTLKGYNTAEIKQIYKSKKAEYIGFGLVANVLEAIPFLNLLFIFTDTIGAALWVAKVENEQKREKLRELLASELHFEDHPELAAATGISVGGGEEVIDGENGEEVVGVSNGSVKSIVTVNSVVSVNGSTECEEVDIDQVEDIDHPDIDIAAQPGIEGDQQTNQSENH